MTIKIVQATGAATTTASPTSVTVNFAATQAGSFLVLIAGVGGTSTNGTTPTGGWSVLVSRPQTPHSTRIYTFANNPGGLTSAVPGFSGTTQGGAAIFLEFADDTGCPCSFATTPNGQTNTGSATYGTAITAPQLPTNVSGFVLLALFQNSAATVAGSPSAGFAFTQPVAEQLSTTATTNYRLRVYAAMSQLATMQTISGAGLSLSGSTDHSEYSGLVVGNSPSEAIGMYGMALSAGYSGGSGIG